MLHWNYNPPTSTANIITPRLPPTVLSCEIISNRLVCGVSFTLWHTIIFKNGPFWCCLYKPHSFRPKLREQTSDTKLISNLGKEKIMYFGQIFVSKWEVESSSHHRHHHPKRVCLTCRVYLPSRPALLDSGWFEVCVVVVRPQRYSVFTVVLNFLQAVQTLSFCKHAQSLKCRVVFWNCLRIRFTNSWLHIYFMFNQSSAYAVFYCLLQLFL